tara:strand:- start:817 stop:1089 length:273 start_codon:yes stop_codon:yes gene_type:complete
MNEIFEYFFEAYFHQDWRDDYASSLEAVEDYSESEPTESKAQLAEALAELSGKSDLPQDTINKLGGNFKPETEGMSVNEWIGRVLEIIDS